MSTANKFLAEKNYPLWTQVLFNSPINRRSKFNCILFFFKYFIDFTSQVNRIVDGGEPTLFKQYFSSWKEETLGAHHHLPVPSAVKNDRIAGGSFFFFSLYNN